MLRTISTTLTGSLWTVILIGGCSSPTALSSAPVEVTQAKYVKETNSIAGAIRNKTANPLASVILTFKVYKGGTIYAPEDIKLLGLKPSETRQFNTPVSVFWKQEDISKVVLTEIETSEPAHYGKNELDVATHKE